MCVCVCVDSTGSWTLCLCLGVGEVMAVLLASRARKNPCVFTLGLTDAPQGAPSPWRPRLIDGCHAAEGQIGGGRVGRGVALWHIPSIHLLEGAEGVNNNNNKRWRTREDQGGR